VAHERGQTEPAASRWLNALVGRLMGHQRLRRYTSMSPAIVNRVRRNSFPDKEYDNVAGPMKFVWVPVATYAWMWFESMIEYLPLNTTNASCFVTCLRAGPDEEMRNVPSLRNSTVSVVVSNLCCQTPTKVCGCEQPTCATRIVKKSAIALMLATETTNAAAQAGRANGVRHATETQSRPCLQRSC